MNRDPLGLGVLMYGYKITDGTVFEPGLFSLVSSSQMSLVHEDCSVSTFCKNPLHPRPCKGWKKSLGIEAPGALKAIESAHKEKLAVSRAKRAEAKSTAEKALTARHLSSPLHAKKATVKHANILLGNDEEKAGKKADRVILNKTEVKRYSKIKAAHINSVRAKHGLEEDPGLEDRLAEAFAKDNQGGKDDNYKAAIRGSAESLGAQLAVEHCHKGNHKECDDKVQGALRDHLTGAAEHALLTGDDEQLDTALADWDSGKLDLTPAKPQPKIPQSTKGKAIEDANAKAAAAEAAKPKPPEGAKPKNLKISEAGLAEGDKVWAYPTGTPNPPHGTFWHNAKTPGEPQLVTVHKKSGTNLGLAKGVTIYEFKNDKGENVGGGTGAAKNWMSPVDKPEFDDPAPKKPKVPKADIGTPSAPVAEGDGFHKSKAENLFGGMAGSVHDETPAKKLALLQAMTPEEHATLSDDAKGNIADFLDHQQAKWAPLGGNLHKLTTNLKAKFGTGKAPAPKKSLKDLVSIDADADHAALIDAVHGMTPAEFEALTPGDKAVGMQLLSDAVVMKLPGADAALSRWKTIKNGVPDKPTVPAPSAPAMPGSPDAAAAVKYATGAVSGTAGKKIVAYEKVSGHEFEQLPPEHQQAILADLLAVKDTFLAAKKKQQAQDHYDYLSKFMGGGAGAGGGTSTPGAAAISMTPAEKMAKAQSSLDHLVQVFAMPGSPAAGGDPAAIATVKDSFTAIANSSGQDWAAKAIAPVWAEDGLYTLANMHVGGTHPGIGPDELEKAKPALSEDIEKLLRGEDGPTPHLDNLKKALQTGNAKDAEHFISQAHAAAPLLIPSSPAIITPTPGADPVGVFNPGPGYASVNPAADGVLFSAFKSAHKGSVLSHSNEEIYNNLLAVAQHYAGKNATQEFYGGDPEFPVNLSVLQVAKAVDIKLSQTKGVPNQDVLQTKMHNWLQTPAGQKYVEEHPVAGTKWSENLSGHGAGSDQAAKIGLTLGAPVGQRAQKPIASRNGKAPKFNPGKEPTDFRPLTSDEISQAQQDYMDQAGHQWTPGEAESLANYTTGAYYELNSYLRGETKDGAPVNTISKLGLERIALNQAGMRPLQQDTLLKRGTGWQFLPEEYRSAEGAEKLIGKTVQDHAFVSTTVGGEDGNFHDHVMLHIEAPKGTPSAWVKHISHNPTENEVVLAAGTKFRILSVQKGMTTVIRVRVVG